MLVGGNGCEGENLGPNGLLQVNHQTHPSRRVLPHADAGNGRVVGPHLGHQLLQGRVQVNALNVHRQPGRVLHQLRCGAQRCIGFDGDACVVWRWPQPHRQNTGAASQLPGAQGQHQGASLQKVAAFHGGSSARPVAL